MWLHRLDTVRIHPLARILQLDIAQFVSDVHLQFYRSRGFEKVIFGLQVDNLLLQVILW